MTNTPLPVIPASQVWAGAQHQVAYTTTRDPVMVDRFRAGYIKKGDQVIMFCPDTSASMVNDHGWGCIGVVAEFEVVEVGDLRWVNMRLETLGE